MHIKTLIQRILCALFGHFFIREEKSKRRFCVHCGRRKRHIDELKEL